MKWRGDISKALSLYIVRFCWSRPSKQAVIYQMLAGVPDTMIVLSYVCLPVCGGSVGLLSDGPVLHSISLA